VEDADEPLWAFIEGCGLWLSRSYGFPRMVGRVLGWLLVCEPVEQTAAQLAEALNASSGAISGATGMLVRAKLVDRIRVRGERADRFRVRPGAWDEQLRDQGQMQAERTLIGQGLDALADAPAARRARLEELDAFYAWWQERMPALWEEWQEHKRSRGGAR
jgi:DNA-binding transcriptional regulator GbsR (MarR family)